MKDIFVVVHVLILLRATVYHSTLFICFEEASQPPDFLFHVFERSRIPQRIRIHPQRLRRSRTTLRGRCEIVRDRAFLLLKFRVNDVVLRPGESIALQASWEEVDMDVRYGLSCRRSVLHRTSVHPPSAKRGDAAGGRAHLTRNGEPICIVGALDDASDALDGVHELPELVRAQVGEARNWARGAH
jgi:hypothetical protein